MAKFKLTPQEVNSVKGREKAIDYMLDLIKRDINMYLYMDVVPRLGLDNEGEYELSPDREWIHTVDEKESKIILPKNGK
jgi:hypothetical protein